MHLSLEEEAAIGLKTRMAMIYELRIYTAHPGKLQALIERFRDVVCGFFEQYGIETVGFWTNTIEGRTDELCYLLAYEDLAHREHAWAALRADSDFKSQMAASEKHGPLVHSSEKRIMVPTDFSPLT